MHELLYLLDTSPISAHFIIYVAHYFSKTFQIWNCWDRNSIKFKLFYVNSELEFERIQL